MKFPPNYTEKEVLDIIDNVANRLAGKFRFGYHDIDDMKQQARMEAWEALSRYDNKRSLENFLWTHVRNRLFNYKRNKYKRPNKPCHTCPHYDPHLERSSNECAEFADKLECPLYKSWYTRNTAKSNLMQPVKIEDLKDEKEDSVKIVDSIGDNAILNESMEKIDRELHPSFREDFIKVRNNVKIPKDRRLALFDAIKEIVGDI